LPVGTNGQVLTADSAEATGLKWAAGGMTNPMTTAGDLVVGGAGGAPTRLAAPDPARQLMRAYDGTLKWMEAIYVVPNVGASTGTTGTGGTGASTDTYSTSTANQWDWQSDPLWGLQYRMLTGSTATGWAQLRCAGNLTTSQSGYNQDEIIWSQRIGWGSNGFPTAGEDFEYLSGFWNKSPALSPGAGALSTVGGQFAGLRIDLTNGLHFVLYDGTTFFVLPSGYTYGDQRSVRFTMHFKSRVGAKFWLNGNYIGEIAYTGSGFDTTQAQLVNRLAKLAGTASRGILHGLPTAFILKP
jgi:hypothetical protein